MISCGDGWDTVQSSLPSFTRCSVRANDLVYLKLDGNLSQTGPLNPLPV